MVEPSAATIVRAPAMAPRTTRGLDAATLGTLPFLLFLLGWALLPYVVDYPPYMLPSIGTVLDYARESILDGSLPRDILASLARLAIGFVIGMGLAIPLGLAIALNRYVADLCRPVLSFLQAIAGIAWVPLTIIWFGMGNGSVIFVIANTIFFSALYNTVIGVQSIPLALHRAVRSHGGRGIGLLSNLILPGAMVQILLGIRTSVAYGWRALVASEMIAGSNGLGYMTMEAVQWQRTEKIILGMIVIGLLWVIMDRAVFTVIERRTVGRWGLLQR
ncbi:MAG TPA: ABC transporter permease [Casimicrobiaceae bacterium]|nr:ABC transporter permease [Casimicrobiaceae bacterium]